VELWSLATQIPGPPSVLAEVLSARRAGSPSRTLNSLAVLQEMGLVVANDDRVDLVHDKWAAEAIYGGLRQAVLAHYCGLLRETILGPVFQHDPGTGELQVVQRLLPYREKGLPYLLLEFGLILRSDAGTLAVAPDAVPAFLDVLAFLNEKALRTRVMTPDELDAWLAARRAAGETAEAFAMEFERRRLGGHRLLDQIRWVSTDDVGAGFDILSFDDQRSLLLDRSIEVKGYSGERAFHWSKEEIDTARRKREAYWLYLVDRDRIGDQGYVPEMLNDPYTYLIEVNPAGWSREATGYLFKAPEALIDR
jgi:hypothetical protein